MDKAAIIEVQHANGDVRQVYLEIRKFFGKFGGAPSSGYNWTLPLR